MSKKGEFRQFHLGFWTASNVEDLDPIEKLLYIYMITSPKSNMEGVYKTTLRRIAFETGIDRDMIPKISARFEESGIGGIYQDGSTTWVVVSHAPEFMTASPSIQTYFSENVGRVPADVVEFMDKAGYRWPKWAEKPVSETPPTQGVDTPTTPPPHPVHTVGTPWVHTVSDTDTNTNTKTDTKTDTDQVRSDEREPGTDLTATTGETKQPKPMPPLKDPIAAKWEDALTAIQPPDTWSNFAQERRQCVNLAKRSANMLGQSPYRSPDELIQSVIAEYRRLKDEAKRSDTYWRNAPYTPGAVLTRWSQIWESLASRYEDDAKQQAFSESISEVVF